MKTNMKTLNQFAVTLTAIAVSASLTACGSRATDASASSALTSTSSTGSITTPTEPTNNTSGLNPAAQQYYTLSGAAGPRPTVSLSLSTEATLKVRIQPLPAPNSVTTGSQYIPTDFAFPYGCISVNVTVSGSNINNSNGATQVATAKVPVVGANDPSCPGSLTYQDLDFSSTLTGNGNVTITIDDADYDNCRLYVDSWMGLLAYQYSGCGLAPVWATSPKASHIVAFNATVQVDGTYMPTAPSQ